MADETATAVADNSGTMTTQEAESQEKTVLDHVMDEVEKAKDKEETSQEAESKTDGEDKKGKVKLTANERVRQAVNEKNEAEAKLKEEMEKSSALDSQLKTAIERIESIEKRLQSGEITKAEAKEEVKEEIEDIEIDDDLAPYKDKLIKMAEKIADRIVSSKLQPLLEKEKLMEQERMKEESEKYSKELFDHYQSESKNYPELFEEAKNGELPAFKPEFEKKAMDYAKFAEVTIMIDGKPTIYNPLLGTKQGLSTLFAHLYKDIEAVKKVKSDVERIDKIKRSRVESPESRHVSSNEPKDILQLTEETLKEFQT
jgi:DNA repair exonuclease SbcCD ATPase subunit